MVVADQIRKKASEQRRAQGRTLMAEHNEPSACCYTCGTRLGKKNKTGYCMRHWQTQQRSDGKPLPRCKTCDKEIGRGTRTGYCVAHYPKRKPLPGNEPMVIEPDDGIIDELAVELAAYGVRKVRMTIPERHAAILMMHKMHLGIQEMATNLGTTPAQVTLYLDDMGYEVITDPAVSALHYRLITRKDRSKAKLLDPEMPRSQKPLHNGR
jgi:hypothetical protein